MRVIAVLEPGGAQLGALRLDVALRRHRIASRLIAGDATPEGLALAHDHGLEVESFATSAGLQWTPSPAFAAWLQPRLAAADVVHAHMFGAWWASAQHIRPGVPLVASEHNALNWPGTHHAREFRDALRRVDRFYAHGPAAYAYTRALGCPPPRLRHGTSSIAGAGARPHPWLPAPRIVFTGRLAADKGPDVLVEALARMPDDAPPAYLLGAGAMLPALRRRTRELGIAGRVDFPGWQPEPGRWVAGASAFVVPSREEAWSQSAVLAMALGVPVIGAAVEGLPEVLGERRGVLVAPEDPEALAAAMTAVLAGRRRPDLQAARDYAARFTPARTALRYAQDYRALTGVRFELAAPAGTETR